MKHILLLVSLFFALTSVASVSAEENLAETAPDSRTIALTIVTPYKHRGEDVKAVQMTLIDEGLLVMPKGVSLGYYGPLTRAAMRKHNLAVVKMNEPLVAPELPKRSPKETPAAKPLTPGNGEKGVPTKKHAPRDDASNIAGTGINLSQYLTFLTDHVQHYDPFLNGSTTKKDINAFFKGADVLPTEALAEIDRQTLYEEVLARWKEPKRGWAILQLVQVLRPLCTPREAPPHKLRLKTG